MSLEYALRDRLPNEIQTGKFREKRPGLQKLLRYAIENQLVKNEGFDRWASFPGRRVGSTRVP